MLRSSEPPEHADATTTVEIKGKVDRDVEVMQTSYKQGRHASAAREGNAAEAAASKRKER